MNPNPRPETELEKQRGETIQRLQAELATAQSELVEVRSKLNREIENHDSLRSQLTEAQKLISDNHLVIEGLGDDLKEANAKLAEAERERDLAIAHDRQPYPTAHAYETACAALNKHRANNIDLQTHVENLKDALRRITKHQTPMGGSFDQWYKEINAIAFGALNSSPASPHE